MGWSVLNDRALFIRFFFHNIFIVKNIIYSIFNLSDRSKRSDRSPRSQVLRQSYQCVGWYVQNWFYVSRNIESECFVKRVKYNFPKTNYFKLSWCSLRTSLTNGRIYSWRNVRDSTWKSAKRNIELYTRFDNRLSATNV